jgi:hypothetical protein
VTPRSPSRQPLNIVPPVITHEPLINTYDTQTAYRVTCTLEPLGLYDPESVRLLWQTDRAPGVIHTQQMTQLSGNLFEGAIAPQPARTRVTYRLTAANHAGYEGGWPADADNASFHVTDRLNLEVCGSPFDIGPVAPDYGTTYFASGLVATATAPPLVPVTDSTRYAATGFFGTGSTPAKRHEPNRVVPRRHALHAGLALATPTPPHAHFRAPGLPRPASLGC